MTITALVPTYNCERTLRECLESLAWVDEILIVDSFSTDATLEIGRAFTDNILTHEYVNSAQQKNWALESIKTQWVLQVDSDERLEPVLAQEIRDALARDDAAEGYRMRRKNLVWGRWCSANNMYPDWQLRLFRLGRGRWSDRAVHARVQGLERVRDLQGHIIHCDIESVEAELTQFSTQFMNWEVQELLKRGKRWRWIDVTLRPLAIFLVYYFRHGGFREGFRGFYFAVFRALYSFMTYARLYEYEVQQGLRQ